MCSRNRVKTSVGEHGEQVGRLEDEDRDGQDLGHLGSCRLWKEAGFSFHAIRMFWVVLREEEI